MCLFHSRLDPESALSRIEYQAEAVIAVSAASNPRSHPVAFHSHSA
jgi:hypothetical protein